MRIRVARGVASSNSSFLSILDIESWMHAGSLEITRDAWELLKAQPRATLASCACYVVNREWYMGERRYGISLQVFNSITRHLTRSLRSLMSDRVEHLKRNSISTHAHVLFPIYDIARAQEAGVSRGLRLESRATLMLLSCSPNFPRTSITRYTSNIL